MKRLASIALAVIFCFSLCGCKGENSGSDRRFTVAALGFSSDGALINVFAETVIVNSEDPEISPEARVIGGTGATISEALDKIGACLSRPILLNHCAVIALGEDMTAGWLDKICDYCFKENRITMSAYMVSVKDPNMLLSRGPEASVAVGYDIMGMIEQQSERTGLAYNSRYFEVEARREGGKSVFTLPHFSCGEDSMEIDGLSVFYRDRLAARLDNGSSGLYALMTGNFRRGTLRFGAEEYTVESRRVDCAYNDTESKKIILKLKIAGDTVSKTAKNRLEKELAGLESRLKAETGADVFGFCDSLRLKSREFEDNYGKDYLSFYKNADFSVECYS